MKLFKYFSNVLCSHYGRRIINLRWLECFLPWAMSNEAKLSSLRCQNFWKLINFLLVMIRLPCRIVFLKHLTWHSLDHNFIFSSVFFFEKPVWCVCVFDVENNCRWGDERKWENLISWKMRRIKNRNHGLSFLDCSCSTRQHEIEGKMSLLLFIAAGGLWLRKKKLPLCKWEK